MAKIGLHDNAISSVAKMSNGNPGAMNAMMEILTKAPKIDPKDFMGGLSAILLMDTFEIYGSDIYVLYSDICERNVAKMLAVLRATQFGMFDQRLLKEACSRQDYSGRKMVPVGELYEKVKDKMPEFDSGNSDE